MTSYNAITNIKPQHHTEVTSQAQRQCGRRRCPPPSSVPSPAPCACRMRGAPARGIAPSGRAEAASGSTAARGERSNLTRRGQRQDRVSHFVSCGSLDAHSWSSKRLIRPCIRPLTAVSNRESNLQGQVRVLDPALLPGKRRAGLSVTVAKMRVFASSPLSLSALLSSFSCPFASCP